MLRSKPDKSSQARRASLSGMDEVLERAMRSTIARRASSFAESVKEPALQAVVGVVPPGVVELEGKLIGDGRKELESVLVQLSAEVLPTELDIIRLEASVLVSTDLPLVVLPEFVVSNRPLPVRGC